MSEPNYAGNIIINLANLPDFLRNPILKKRVLEFFSIESTEKIELINNALEAGPTIPFPNFSKLFKSWLEILTGISEIQRQELFFYYLAVIVKSPQKLINFNLDGILEIFNSLDFTKRQILSITIGNVISKLDENSKKILLKLIPDNAKKELNI